MLVRGEDCAGVDCASGGTADAAAAFLLLDLGLTYPVIIDQFLYLILVIFNVSGVGNIDRSSALVELNRPSKSRLKCQKNSIRAMT